jgi:hypothetical protein
MGNADDRCVSGNSAMGNSEFSNSAFGNSGCYQCAPEAGHGAAARWQLHIKKPAQSF